MSVNITFRRSKMRSGLAFLVLIVFGLSGCGGAVDEIKGLFAQDVYGAIGFSAKTTPPVVVVAPGDNGCSNESSSGTSTSSVKPPPRCLSSAEAANAIYRQCAADCEVVLTFQGTTENSVCGSIAVAENKKFGVGSGSSVTIASNLAMAACTSAAGPTSSCAVVKSRCL